jgi:hypothetical protein
MKKKLILGVFLTLIVGICYGFGSRGLEYNNFTSLGAYYIYPPQSVIYGADPVLDTTGKTEVSCDVNPSERTAVLVFIGQSLSVNSIPSIYTPTQSGNHQLNIYDGKCYETKEPLLGINVSGGAVTAQRGTWMSRLADRLIANGHYDRVIIVPMAVGNTRADQWASNSSAPYLKNNINVVARRLAQAKLHCTAIHWGQGESDTSAGTSQAAYTTALNSLIAEFNRTMPGCPILVAREAYYYGATSSAVLAAQDAAPNGTTVFAGENLETIGPSGRYDNTHLNETGADQRAVLVEQALINALGL